MNPNDRIEVSFVVPTRNRAALLIKTIESILDQSGAAPIEILVVDNCSTDGSRQAVGKLICREAVPIRFIAMDVNNGPAASRNFGASSAQGEFIAFVDSDVVLDREWLSRMLTALRAHPEAGIATGKVVFASSPDRIHCFGGELSRIGLGWDGGQGDLASGILKSEWKLWAPSASVIVRRKAFLEAGGFDDTYFYGYEDSDLGWRLNIEGWNCMCACDAVAIHATSARIDEKACKVGAEVVFHYSKNRIRSLIKNYSLGSLCLYLPLALGYSVADAVLRTPRASRCKALLWNIIHLPDTLRKRRIVQNRRARADSDLAHLFSKRLFPAVPLRRRMQAMQELAGYQPVTERSISK